MDNISVPVLSYDDIRIYAGKFLSKYNPSQKVPIPIEEIIEINFRIDIIPIPGFQ